MLIYGLFTIINGKMPFITKYSGIKNISLHCRIEGSAILLASLFNYLNLDSVFMMIFLITLCIITIIIEIILKVF